MEIIDNNNNNYKDFIEGIRNAYKENRNVRVYQECKERIKRGRSHSISSTLEDYVACLLLKELNNDEIYIFVDQPIIKKQNGKTKTYYPDIMVCKCNINENKDDKKLAKEYTCFYMCDIKTDVGWKRDKLPDICKVHLEQLDDLKKIDNIQITAKDGINKSLKYIFNIENDAKYDVVFVSCGNGVNNLESLKEKFQKKDKKYRDNSKKTNCFLLSEGDHINVYKDDENKISVSKTTDYDNWIKRIINSIK